jgi:hypothetical protein
MGYDNTLESNASLPMRVWNSGVNTGKAVVSGCKTIASKINQAVTSLFRLLACSLAGALGGAFVALLFVAQELSKASIFVVVNNEAVLATIAIGAIIGTIAGIVAWSKSKPEVIKPQINQTNQTNIA